MDVQQIKAVWKLLLSFLKRDWTASDYPVRIRKQSHASTEEQIPAYQAQVINWWTLGGLGDTPEEAMLDLQRSLDNFNRHNGYLHRPGAKVPIEFASTGGVDRHPEVASRFLTEVLGFEPDDPVFISDESSLLDFDGLREGVDLFERVREVFGVDVTDIEDGNLRRIIERLKEAA